MTPWYWPAGLISVVLSVAGVVVGSRRGQWRRKITGALAVVLAIVLVYPVLVVNSTVGSRCVYGEVAGVRHPDSRQTGAADAIRIGYRIDVMKSNVVCWWERVDGARVGVPWSKPLFQFTQGVTPLYPNR